VTGEVAVLALLGDVMLGRSVAGALERDGPAALFSHDLVAVIAEADAVLANLECCVSDRGERWPDPRKPFFFRAPPVAVEALQRLGTTAVTLANNHALDYGYDALLDTLTLLHDAGISTTGAGGDVNDARRPAQITVRETEITVIGCTDHPADFSALASRPGVAFAALGETIDPWLVAALRDSMSDCVIVTPHWGPNMVSEPVPRVRAAASGLRRAGASLVVGHSAHVFHGIQDRVLFDLGDFVDDYMTHPDLRNDLGLLFLLELDRGIPVRVSAVPIALDFCRTRRARREEATWIGSRFTAACRALGTTVRADDDRFVVDLAASPVP
jgi:poly-gamma-glutamate capsule biosynthesis protein CapA/YwtB (metallophosphatase superfamily)